VDVLEEKLEELGTVLVSKGLKVELGPSEQEKAACRELGKQVVLAAAGVK
jgi:flavodoxin I